MPQTYASGGTGEFAVSLLVSCKNLLITTTSFRSDGLGPHTFQSRLLPNRHLGTSNYRDILTFLILIEF
jgi:hypothetical protein